jgi:hypothetical protein
MTATTTNSWSPVSWHGFGVTWAQKAARPLVLPVLEVPAAGTPIHDEVCRHFQRVRLTEAMTAAVRAHGGHLGPGVDLAKPHPNDRVALVPSLPDREGHAHHLESR